MRLGRRPGKFTLRCVWIVWFWSQTSIWFHMSCSNSFYMVGRWSCLGVLTFYLGGQNLPDFDSLCSALPCSLWARGLHGLSSPYVSLFLSSIGIIAVRSWLVCVQRPWTGWWRRHCGNTISVGGASIYCGSVLLPERVCLRDGHFGESLLVFTEQDRDWNWWSNEGWARVPNTVVPVQ